MVWIVKIDRHRTKAKSVVEETNMTRTEELDVVNRLQDTLIAEKVRSERV